MPPPISIFYDLETSSQSPVGQILNYCFIAVDKDWNEVDRIAGLVRISRLQLPEPAAINANKIDVLKHQEEAKDSENIAAHKIYAFLEKYKNSCLPDLPPLIGHNSEKFDLPFLRTVLIRNALSPYQLFNGGDSLLLARYLYSTDETFREMTTVVSDKDGKHIARLKLEHLGRVFQISDEEQTHESSLDVELMIKICRKIETQFKIDVRSFAFYGLHKHEMPRGVPCRIRGHNKSKDKPYSDNICTFVKREGNASLWICLENYKKHLKKPRKLSDLFYRWKHFGDLQWPIELLETDDEYADLAKSAVAEFSHVTVDDLYPPTDCYIEAFIYRIKPELISSLEGAFRGGLGTIGQYSADVQSLVKRYLIENAGEILPGSELFEVFRGYCGYRYGGKMQLERHVVAGKERKRGEFHLSLAEMRRELAEFRGKAEVNRVGIFDSLAVFYSGSELQHLKSHI